jgi:hypothetical protein
MLNIYDSCSRYKFVAIYILTAVCVQISVLLSIKIQPDATVCRYLFTAKSLYMFRVSHHPSSGVLKTVTAATGTGHTVKYKD